MKSALEPGTPFYARAQRGEQMIPDENICAAMFELTQSLCTDAGLLAYEISNHARTGQESRHNLAYWQYDDYLGIGPGAHGRVILFDNKTNGPAHKYATTTHRAPAIYLQKVSETGHALHAPKKLSHADRLQECLMMGLRLTSGVQKSKIAFHGGREFSEIFSEAALHPFIQEKLLWMDGDAIGATPAGAMKLNALTKALIAKISLPAAA